MVTELYIDELVAAQKKDFFENDKKTNLQNSIVLHFSCLVNQWTLKLLLLPLAILYGLGVAILNGLYAIGLLRGVTFSIPVISIGNLTVGGTGKTPHTEYLIRLLHEYLPLAVVSRGYKRKTTGYLEVAPNHDASQSGDEPLQYKRKYPHVPVAVAESRSFAIPQVIRNYPYTKVILLDLDFLQALCVLQ